MQQVKFLFSRLISVEILIISEPAEQKEKVKKDEIIQEQYQLVFKRHQFNYYSPTLRGPSVQYFPVNDDHPEFTITFRIKQECTSDEWNTIFNRGRFSVFDLCATRTAALLFREVSVILLSKHLVKFNFRCLSISAV